MTCEKKIAAWQAGENKRQMKKIGNKFAGHL